MTMLVKRGLRGGPGQRVLTMSMEGEFWDALAHISRETGLREYALVMSVDVHRDRAGTLTGAVRCFVVAWLMRKAEGR